MRRRGNAGEEKGNFFNLSVDRLDGTDFGLPSQFGQSASREFKTDTLHAGQEKGVQNYIENPERLEYECDLCIQGENSKSWPITENKFVSMKGLPGQSDQRQSLHSYGFYRLRKRRMWGMMLQTQSWTSLITIKGNLIRPLDWTERKMHQKAIKPLWSIVRLNSWELCL